MSDISEDDDGFKLNDKLEPVPIFIKRNSNKKLESIIRKVGKPKGKPARTMSSVTRTLV